MGKLRNPEPVKLFTAITFSDTKAKDDALDKLVLSYGPIDTKSVIFDFTFTNYYREEMGGVLSKQFLSFGPLIDPVKLIDIKIHTNEIEDAYANEGKRIVNIDPGYINAAKLILATTKDFSHRVYLGKQIYGDIHMMFINGKLTANNWTYPDYKQELAINFFTELKHIYMENLRAHRYRQIQTGRNQ